MAVGILMGGGHASLVACFTGTTVFKHSKRKQIDQVFFFRSNGQIASAERQIVTYW